MTISAANDDAGLPIRDLIAVECLALDRLWAPATTDEVEHWFGLRSSRPWSQMELAARRAYAMADAMITARTDQKPSARTDAGGKKF